MMVRFATTCDICGRRSPEWTMHSACRECDRHICPACAVPGTTMDADLESPASCVCRTCGPDVVREAEKLLAAITPGEWSQWGDISTHAVNAKTPTGIVRVVGGEHDAVPDGRQPLHKVGIMRFHDAEFIAAAPRLVRDLLIQLREVTQQASEGVAFCSYCTTFNIQYAAGDGPAQLKAAESLAAHVRECPDNPLVQKLREVTQQRDTLAQVKGELWADWQARWDEEHARVEQVERELREVAQQRDEAIKALHKIAAASRAIREGQDQR